jgi:hypothetical protein
MLGINLTLARRANPLPSRSHDDGSGASQCRGAGRPFRGKICEGDVLPSAYALCLSATALLHCLL